jgi:hypothetical protein
MFAIFFFRDVNPFFLEPAVEIFVYVSHVLHTLQLCMPIKETTPSRELSGGRCYLLRGNVFMQVLSLGLEPRQGGPKSPVLPLHHERIDHALNAGIRPVRSQRSRVFALALLRESAATTRLRSLAFLCLRLIAFILLFILSPLEYAVQVLPLCLDGYKPS